MTMLTLTLPLNVIMRLILGASLSASLIQNILRNGEDAPMVINYLKTIQFSNIFRINSSAYIDSFDCDRLSLKIKSAAGCVLPDHQKILVGVRKSLGKGSLYSPSKVWTAFRLVDPCIVNLAFL